MITTTDKKRNKEGQNIDGYIGCGCGIDNLYTYEENECLTQFNYDLQIGYQNLTQKYREFNDKSVVQFSQILSDVYNMYLPPFEGEPEDAWMFNSRHPLSTTKIILLTANVLTNAKGIAFKAFHTNRELDRNTAKVCDSIYQNTKKASNINGKKAELHNALNAAIHPVSIQRVDLDLDKDNMWESGIIRRQVPISQFMIDNPYADIQEQRFVIEQYIVSYARLKYLFPNNKKLEDVKANQFGSWNGTVFTYDKRLFQRLSGKKTLEGGEFALVQYYYNESLKKEITVVNGVMLECKDYKYKYYPYTRTIALPFANSDFFYGFSIGHLTLSSQITVDTLIDNQINTETINSNMPLVASGDNIGDLKGQNISPNTILETGSNTTLAPLRPYMPTTGLQNATMMIRSLMNEATGDAFAGGQAVQYLGRQVAGMAQQNFDIKLTFMSEQLTMYEMQVANIIMERLIDSISYYDVDKMGIPLYPSLFLEDPKYDRVAFELFDTEEENVMLEKQYQLKKIEDNVKKKVLLTNPVKLKDILWKVYMADEPNSDLTSSQLDAIMKDNWNFLRMVYQADAEKLNMINKAFSSVLFKGTEVPEGLFDTLPKIPMGGLGGDNQNNQAVSAMANQGAAGLNTRPQEQSNMATDLQASLASLK